MQPLPLYEAVSCELALLVLALALTAVSMQWYGC
jgi:hypothetical protein